MPTLTEFTPLRAETIDSIRARIDANVNAGLVESDGRWQETVPGGFFFDHTQSMALEAEFLWDFGSTELPASFFLPFSWGIYLDYWGELLEVPRKPAVAATGMVTFTNESEEAQLIPSGTEVAAPATTPGDDPLTYTTTATVEVPASGTVSVGVVATEVGSAFDVPGGAVSLITSPSSELSVTNANPIGGGEDEELDEPYKERLLLEFTSARGGGTPDDYIAESLALPSVGSVVVQPHFAGPNTVRIIIADAHNAPVSAEVVEAVQDFWDPPGESGLGAGQAPIDAEVTVATVEVTTVAVAMKVELEPGFTITGAGGSVNVTDEIHLALTTYFSTLKAGDRVQYSRVIAAVIAIDGIFDVHTGTLLLNGSAEDLLIEELHSAQLGEVTLEEEPAP